MEVKNVKGTKDVFGIEAKYYEKVTMLMKALAELYSFEEMVPPVLEHSEVFVRGVGESSDVVRKEMYTFEDKGGRSLTLRPEFTAGIIRTIVQNKLYATKDLPIKQYYCGPVFRYERPQLGRYRQFNQFGVEAVGSQSYFTDVEVIALGYSILQSLGFEGVTLKVNTLGDEESREEYKVALKEFFKDNIDKMCPDCQSRFELNPLRILDCKVPEDQEIVKHAPKMFDYLSIPAKQRFDDVCQALEDLGIPFEVDDTLVRGLDYYSETVFEFHYLSKKNQNYGAIGAGGHYSKLVKEFGGPELPGVGFSFGIERVVAALVDDGLLNEDVADRLDAYVIPVGEEAQSVGLMAATALRCAGYSADINLENVKLGSMIKKAVKKHARFAVIIGEEEINNDVVVLKDLDKNEQMNVSFDDLIERLDDVFSEEEEAEECCCGEGECTCGHHHHDS